MEEGDTFISPAGPHARFPEREMRVTKVWKNQDRTVWVDAEPVSPLDSDEFFHAIFELDKNGKPMPAPSDRRGSPTR